MRLGHHARISGVNTVHIGIDLALIGLECGRERDTGGVRTAASERGDVAFLVHALETGDDHHAALIQVLVDAPGINVLNACFAESTIGTNVYLMAGIGAGRATDPGQRHGKQRNGGLLAGSEQHIELARGWDVTHRFGQLDEAVGLAAHGGNHNHNVMALCAHPRHLFSNGSNAVRTSDGRAAVLLDDQGHDL